MKTIHLIVIGIVFVIVGAYFVMLSWPQQVSKPNDFVACTQEAKSCPDGSYVGRTGPQCEFAKCLEMAEGIDTSTWKTYRNEQYGFEVKYPNDWNVNIIESPGIETAIQIISPSAQKGPEGTHAFGPIFDIRIIVNKAYQGRITGQKIKFLGKDAIDTGWYTSNVGGVPVRDIAITGDSEITIHFQGTLLESQKTEESLLDPVLSTFKFVK